MAPPLQLPFIKRKKEPPMKGKKMTIGNAIKFIKRSFSDADLRGRLNEAASKNELDQILAEEFISFSGHDFDEAYNHKLTECQEEEMAEQIKELKQWWDILNQLLEPSACRAECHGDC